MQAFQSLEYEYTGVFYRGPDSIELSHFYFEKKEDAEDFIATEQYKNL